MEGQELDECLTDTREGILALLENTESSSSSFYDETESREERQERQCASLLFSLQRLRAAKGPTSPNCVNDIDPEQQTGDHGQFIRTNMAGYNNKSQQRDDSDSPFSIREAIGNLPSASTSQLAPALTSFLTRRVDVSDLLPATQDDRGNENAMGGHAAITLTRLSLVAAHLYAELIGMPGAWGAGLIDVGALSSLSALLRRWCVECRGREPSVGRNREKETFKRKSSNADRAPPTKRSRKKNPRRQAVLDSIDESDYDDDVSLEQENDDLEEVGDDAFSIVCDGQSAPLSSQELIMLGLRVALALGQVPCNREFLNWSDEAREALLDAIVTSLATSSALIKCSRAPKHATDKELFAMGNQVVVSLSNSLQKSVLIGTRDEDADDTEHGIERMNRNHQISVFVLRGLLNVISMQTELPNGQTGKEAASDAAISALEEFIKSVASDCSKWPMEPWTHRTPSTTTPKTTRGSDSSGEDIATPQTGHKARKRRVSFGDGNDESVARPPTLKKSTTPRRPRLHYGSLTPSQRGVQSRPILSAVVGMLQKLSTAKGLERANVRARTIATLHSCLPHLPETERFHFLRFVIQLCRSKVSVHRLLGAELTGAILCEEWLWRDHGARRRTSSSNAMEMLSISGSASKTPSSRRASLSPLVETSADNMPLALLGTLNGRLSDKVPAVRARSAFSLAYVLRNFSSGEVAWMKAGEAPWTAFKIALTSKKNDMHLCLRKRAALDERATVKKAIISALVELLIIGETQIIQDNSHLCISETDVSVLCRLCGDNSVSTRKAAAEGLSNLLQKCYYTGKCSTETAIRLEHAWSSAVLPLVLDVDSSCVGKALELFSSIVIEPLCEVGGSEVHWEDNDQRRRYMTAWRVLAHASENSRQEGAPRGEAGSLRAVLKKLFADPGSAERDMARSLLKEIRRVAVHTLEPNSEDLEEEGKYLYQDDVEAQRIGVWCLLDALVDCQGELPHLAQVIKRSTVDVEFITASWDAMLQLSLSSSTPDHCVAALRGSMRSCLRVLSKLASLLPVQDAERSSERLEILLGGFALTPGLVETAISALVALTYKCCQESLEAETKEECSRWIRDLYGKCEVVISSYIAGVNQEPISEQETSVVRALFAVGELAMVGFRSDEDSLSRGADVLGEESTESHPVRGLYEPPSKILLGLVQAMLAKHLPKANTASSEANPTPQPVRAHAFVTLGKLCLRDESLAKSCVTLLARELHQNMADMSPAVQSNALLVLGDLCVKYTNLVDRYLPVMAACLQSGTTAGCESALVRKHAVLILSSLLLQDYIKWRGLLFHRFLVASVDDDEGVAKLAEMTLCGPLLTKHPKLFFNNFVESIFVLNRCTAHPIYAAAATTGDNGAGVAVGFEGIDFSGLHGRMRRLQVYKLMLSNMTDEEKIGITARLAKDVLGGALESDGDLSKVCRSPPCTLSPSEQEKSLHSPGQLRDESAFNVLSDAFAILTSPALRVGRISRDDDGIEGGEQVNASQLVVAAKGRLLSKISRKHLIEIVLPILCNLKTLLQASCSPLLKELMRYMVEIFHAYKSEVKEFLANDPTLLQEVEFDARQFKKAQKLETPTRGQQTQVAVVQE